MEDDKPFDKRIDRMLDSDEPIERAAAIIAWGLDRVAKQLEKSASSANGNITATLIPNDPPYLEVWLPVDASPLFDRHAFPPSSISMILR